MARSPASNCSGCASPASSGIIRITTVEHAAHAILWPALAKLLPDHPEIKVEIVVDYGLTDIVAEGYDAGVRLGEQVAKDMIAVRIGPEMRMGVVGAPSYFAGRRKPRTPQDLTTHNCINLRLPTHGGLYAWEFEKGGREVRVRVDGQLVFNTLGLRLEAVLAGADLAALPEDLVQEQIADGRLIRVLADCARDSRVRTSTTQAGASRRRPSRCWWRHCGIGDHRRGSQGRLPKSACFIP